jgi:structural maintenance of chromosome 1
VKDQKDEADAFMIKSEELQDVRSQLILWNIWRIKCQIDEREKAYQNYQELMTVKESEDEELNAQLTLEKKELAKLSKQCAKVEKEFNSKKSNIDEIKASIAEIEVKFVTLKRRENELKRNEDVVAKDLAEQTITMANLNKELTVLNTEETSIRRSLQNTKSGALKLTEDDLSEYNKLREEAVISILVCSHC